jgi:hypothetical protein cdiviTM7_00587
MATYKVPQDVEAEDKLLGPFTFRQFIYLLISAAGIAVIFGLFQIFPLLAIIPVPIVGFFLILALPLKKDQPMEVYLASIASFYLKSNKRLWTPGQKESTIKITAPKIVEKPRARNITEEEASTRLSFLSNLVDSEGYSIRNNSNFNEDFIAETNDVPDILDQNSNQTINQMIAREQENRHANIVSNMKAAISSADQLLPPPSPQMNQSQVDSSNPFQAAIQNLQQGNTTSYQPAAYPQNFTPSPQAYPQNFAPNPQYNQPYNQQFFNQPPIPPQPQFYPNTPFAPQQNYPNPTYPPGPTQATPPQYINGFINQNLNPEVNQGFQNLANNQDFTIDTISKQANRLSNTTQTQNSSTSSGTFAGIFTPPSN